MRKSTLFISAVLTTFVLAMLAGVVSAYQNFVQNDPLETVAQEPPQQLQSVAQSISPATEETVNLTPEEVAALASQVIGRDDLYSVEVTELNGETVYLVTFSSGDLVYISLDGQIRSISKLKVETVVVGSASGRGGGSNNRVSSSSQNHEEHDDDDDHEEREKREEHDEHDDDD